MISNEPMFVLITEGDNVKFVPSNCKKVSFTAEDYFEEDKETNIKEPKQKQSSQAICDLVHPSKLSEEDSDEDLLRKQRDRDKIKAKDREINPLLSVEDDFRRISNGILEDSEFEDIDSQSPSRKYIKLRVTKDNKVSQSPNKSLSDSVEDDVEDIDELNLNGQIYFGKDGKWVNPDKEAGSLSYPKSRGSQYSRSVGKNKGSSKEPCGRRNKDKTCKN
jgi:hypothetical protein